MTTASLVLYKTSRSQIETLLSSVLPSCVAKLIIVDNSPDDRWRELEGRSEKIRYTSLAMRRTMGLRTMGKKNLGGYTEDE